MKSPEPTQIGISKRERKFSSRLPVADSKHKVSSRLPVADLKHKVSNGLPVADSAASCRFSCRFETNYVRAQEDSCRLPIQLPIPNRQYKFNESATNCQLPNQLPIRNRHFQRIGYRQLVAGCRFRFETENISSTYRQLATSCPLPI